MVSWFCLLVGFNNIVDYETNKQFVEHVLAMDTMKPYFKGDELKERAITDPAFVTTSYWLIILGELSAGLFGLYGGLVMLAQHENKKFEHGQSLYVVGGTLALTIWYLGFAVIGAEWFQMWANEWDGQMKAYTFALFILVSMVYVVMPFERFIK